MKRLPHRHRVPFEPAEPVPPDSPMHASLLLPGAIGVALCTPALASTPSPANPVRVREPAVAGLFYPAAPDALARQIDAALAAANTSRTGRLRALICPHAGYDYSGPVAASAFRLLQGAPFSTVILLAPSHYAAMRAASVCDAEVYRTPLGDVPISPRARDLAALPPYRFNPPCRVQRPGWAAHSSRRVPSDAERPETWEHADEVEVPFLQRTLSRFELLPVIFGDVDPAAAAEPLRRVLDEQTLLVVSSDLSHYHSYAEARRRDLGCLEAIGALDLARTAGQEACGLTPILTLLHLARRLNWNPVVLDYRNSGDTAGDRARVVGYGAVAFYEGPPRTGATAEPDRRFLLHLARRAIQEATTTGNPTELAPRAIPPFALVPQGCFVTLTLRGSLRGCIGQIVPTQPLYRTVIENARGAAVRDPRFLPLSAREVSSARIEISLLSPPVPVRFSSPDDLLRQLMPHHHGVVLRIGSRSSTYLPKVWEHFPDKVAFLDSLAEKAGCPPGAWRAADVQVSLYTVESFAEPDPAT